MAVERLRIRERKAGGNYFASPKTNLQFIGSGSKILDLALGGGWVENRVANIVGDKSTGKTLLCIEAAANFARKYPKGQIRYREAEAAFDIPYAGALGMPLDRVDFDKRLDTVEDLFEDLSAVIKNAKTPELYVLDSLDALSDRAELERDMQEGTYGTAKAKNMSQLFRRLVQQIEKSRVTMLVVSQVRSNIGATFMARATTRSGGRALDFYASQVLYLSHTGALSRAVSGITRKYGIKIKAKVDKNKVGLPLREAEFSIIFGFGIDDVNACLDWLTEAKGLGDIDLTESGLKEYRKELMRMSDSDYADEVKRIHDATQARWYQIETSFLPTRRKYGDE